MTSWQKLIRTGALAVIIGAALLGGSPERASAQWVCGICQTVFPIHQFLTASPYPVEGGRDCYPGIGGCHVLQWYTGTCSFHHWPCWDEGDDHEDLAAAITAGDESAIFKGLSGTRGWTISPSSGELLLEGCGGLIVMRASLPSSMTLPPEQPATPAASDRSVAMAVGADRQ